MTEAAAQPLVGPSLLSATLVASLVGLVPALGAGGSGSVWLLGAASAALLLGPATLGVTTTSSSHKPGFWLGAGLVLTLTPLTILGGLLKTSTHHRPLGAATFAVIACIFAVGCVAFCWRAGTLAESSRPSRGRLIRSVVGSAALLSGGWVLLRLARLATSSDFGFAVLQLCLLVSGLWLGSLEKTRKSLAKVPALVGTGVWLSMVLAGAILAITLDPRSLDPRGTQAASTALLWLLFAP